MSSTILQPDSDFSTVTLGSFNFEKKLAKYNENTASNFLVTSAFKFNRKRVRFTRIEFSN